MDSKRDFCGKLNVLFEYEMRKLEDSDFGQFNEYINDYPIIRYEYNIDGGFTRKSVVELIDDLDRSDKKSDKGIYFNLLKSRLNPCKEENDDIDENFEAIENLYKEGKYSGTTQKVLEKLMEISCYYESNKYKGYFYKIGGNRK